MEAATSDRLDQACISLGFKKSIWEGFLTFISRGQCERRQETGEERGF